MADMELHITGADIGKPMSGCSGCGRGEGPMVWTMHLAAEQGGDEELLRYSLFAQAMGHWVVRAVADRDPVARYQAARLVEGARA